MDQANCREPANVFRESEITVRSYLSRIAGTIGISAAGLFAQPLESESTW